jgi:hypothetical protein
MRNLCRSEFIRTAIATVVVIGLFGLFTYQLVFAPAEELRYAPGTVKGNFKIEGELAVTEAGLPVIIANETNAQAVEILKLYHSGRGDGGGVDGDYMDVFTQFSDNVTSSIPTFMRITGNDLDAKGGTYGSVEIWAGSTSPTKICKIDGVSDAVFANFFSVDISGGAFTGMTGSGTQIDLNVGGNSAFQINTTEYRCSTGRDLIVDDNASVGNKFAVGALVGEIPSYSMTFVKSTVDGSMPWPLMTETQRDNISGIGSGVGEGLGVWNTTSKRPNWFEGNNWLEPVTTRSPIVLAFGGASDPYFSTQNAAWTTVAIFHFGGTTALGAPSKIKGIGYKDANPTAWEIRVLDTTNATTIVTKTGNTGTVPEIVDLGTLSNLPAAEAIFEVQIQRNGGIAADFVYAHGLTIEF